MAIGRRYYYVATLLCCALYAATHHTPWPDHGFKPHGGFGNRWKRRREGEKKTAAEELAREAEQQARRNAQLNARIPKDVGERKKRRRAKDPRRGHGGRRSFRGASDAYFNEAEEIKPIHAMAMKTMTPLHPMSKKTQKTTHLLMQLHSSAAFTSDVHQNRQRSSTREALSLCHSILRSAMTVHPRRSHALNTSLEN